MDDPEQHESDEPHQMQSAWPLRLLLTILLMGQVLVRLLRGRLHRRNLWDYLFVVGIGSLQAVLIINTFAGMIFTIQTARELVRIGAIANLGGAFALAFCRELSPILTASVTAGQIGSAYAAELASMKVSEQIDALRMLRTDPVDYLVTPRVVACCMMVPILAVLALISGIGGGSLVAVVFYQQPLTVFLNAVRGAMEMPDIVAVVLKSLLFGLIIAGIGCGWGLTTVGGAKQVGQSATAAVISIWVALFIADFVLSLLLFGTVPGTAAPP